MSGFEVLKRNLIGTRPCAANFAARMFSWAIPRPQRVMNSRAERSISVSTNEKRTQSFELLRPWELMG